jgi:hypothetical protein
MDNGRFAEFWRYLAPFRLNAPGEMPVSTILARALGTWRTCVVCQLLWERAFDLASRWQYLLAEDAETQARFIEGQTWCNRHAWFFKEVASPRTLGRLHRGLHALVVARLGGLLQGDLARLLGGDTTEILRALVGARICFLCEDEAAFEEVVLTELARGLESEELRSDFAASAGCCLPHLAALLHRVGDKDTAQHVLQAALGQLGRALQELDIFEAETESRRRHYGSAADAPARALTYWVGQRGMNPRWEHDPCA